MRLCCTSDLLNVILIAHLPAFTSSTWSFHRLWMARLFKNEASHDSRPEASVSSTFNNLPTAKSRSNRVRPSSLSTLLRRYSPKLLSVPQKSESASSALRHSPSRRGKYPCAVIALAQFFIGSDGKIPYRGSRVPRHS
jgi:hypothetical protein